MTRGNLILWPALALIVTFGAISVPPNAGASSSRTYAHGGMCLRVGQGAPLPVNTIRVLMSTPGQARPKPFVAVKHKFRGPFYWNEWGDIGLRPRVHKAYVVVPDSDGTVPRVSTRRWHALGCW